MTDPVRRPRQRIPPAAPAPANPWTIRKTLDADEIRDGGIRISFHDTFEHVVRHWSLEGAQRLTEGEQEVIVHVRDVTDNPRGQLHRRRVYFRMMGDDFFLECRSLILSRNLQAGNQIEMYYDSGERCFKFRSVR